MTPSRDHFLSSFVLHRAGLRVGGGSVPYQSYMVFTVDPGIGWGSLGLVVDGQPYTKGFTIGGERFAGADPAASGIRAVYPLETLRRTWLHMTNGLGPPWQPLKPVEWWPIRAVAEAARRGDASLLEFRRNTA